MADDLFALAKRLVAFDAGKDAIRDRNRKLLDGDSVRPSRPSAGLNDSARRAATASTHWVTTCRPPG
jgi:hypothetical protein